jgi:hypothetical protein
MESTHLKVWARWVLLTEVGFFGGWYVTHVMGNSVAIRLGLIPAACVLCGLWGAILGAAQWLELSRHQFSAKPVTWILGTSLGQIVGGAVGVVLCAATVGNPLKTTPPLDRAVSAVVIGAAVGLGIGVAQCRALQLKGVDGRRWKVVTAAGMPLGGLAASIWADAFAGGWGTATGTLLFIVAAGLGLGGASGWSLLAQISRSRQVQELVDVF